MNCPKCCDSRLGYKTINSELTLSYIMCDWEVPDDIVIKDMLLKRDAE